eukprot:TRINITY_DN1658_c0_g1_i2.p1 TRINITY_DN1658_c0_g1~~TRINITY_DN1658_c0_g1_i2.p1  ORF type:complete len:290 (+),score=87.66 TRINITY_DN1658_c0_g1_i2:86-871(+)
MLRKELFIAAVLMCLLFVSAAAEEDHGHDHDGGGHAVAGSGDHDDHEDDHDDDHAVSGSADHDDHDRDDSDDHDEHDHEDSDEHEEHGHGDSDDDEDHDHDDSDNHDEHSDDHDEHSHEDSDDHDEHNHDERSDDHDHEHEEESFKGFNDTSAMELEEMYDSNKDGQLNKTELLTFWRTVLGTDLLESQVGCLDEVLEHSGDAVTGAGSADLHFMVVNVALLKAYKLCEHGYTSAITALMTFDVPMCFLGGCYLACHSLLF